MTTSANQPASAPSTGNAGSAAPRQVNTAFWLYIASAAISLIALIVSLTTLGSVSGALATAVTIAVISGILYIAAYALFAFFMRRGANWARIVLLIVTVLSLFGVLSGYGLGAVRVVLGVIATVLIFMKPANEYFATVRSRRVR